MGFNGVCIWLTAIFYCVVDFPEGIAVHPYPLIHIHQVFPRLALGGLVLYENPVHILGHSQVEESSYPASSRIFICDDVFDIASIQFRMLDEDIALLFLSDPPAVEFCQVDDSLTQIIVPAFQCCPRCPFLLPETGAVKRRSLKATSARAPLKASPKPNPGWDPFSKIIPSKDLNNVVAGP